MSKSLIITCEHAGNRIPPEYHNIFKDSSILNSHRGWDPGAWEMAVALANHFKVPLRGCHTTRLLIESNRSLNSSQLFSEFSVGLPNEVKQKLINEIYLPYRNEVEYFIKNSVKPVIHISMHSFTPIWNGEIRKTDIGILFDQSRSFESMVSNLLQENLKRQLPLLAIDFNKPYLGTDDGFTTTLRTQFPDQEYAGIEIEVNQKYSNDVRNIAYALQVAIYDLISEDVI